jgi:small subunit ribosomal protein S16
MKIRLTRMGSMKRPCYRLVVMDSRTRRDGRYTENLGVYQPVPSTYLLELNEERILHWLGQGAQMSGTAENLIRQKGILEKHQLLKEGVLPEELVAKLAEWKAKQPVATRDRSARAGKKGRGKAAAGEGAAEA